MFQLAREKRFIPQKRRKRRSPSHTNAQTSRENKHLLFVIVLLFLLELKLNQTCTRLVQF